MAFSNGVKAPIATVAKPKVSCLQDRYSGQRDPDPQSPDALSNPIKLKNPRKQIQFHTKKDLFCKSLIYGRLCKVP